MSFKQEAMSGAKIGGSAFVAYVANRFLSTMDYAKTILKDSPETGAVIISSGISLGVIKFQDKIKSKEVRVGLVAGSIAATLHLATRIPTIKSAIPVGLVAALAGEDGEYEEIDGEDVENQINAEVDARMQRAFQEGKIQYIKPMEQLAVLDGHQDGSYPVGVEESIYSLDGETDIYSNIG